MTDHRDDSDEALQRRLRDLARATDPVPEYVRSAARAAFSTRDPEATLATLVGDSHADLDEHAYETVRRSPADGASAWLLTFDGGDLGVDLELDHDDGLVTIIGQVSGASVRTCVLERPDAGRTTVPTDELGRFLVQRIAPGPVRLRCLRLSGGWVRTPWVVV